MGALIGPSGLFCGGLCQPFSLRISAAPTAAVDYLQLSHGGGPRSVHQGGSQWPAPQKTPATLFTAVSNSICCHRLHREGSTVSLLPNSPPQKELLLCCIEARAARPTSPHIPRIRVELVYVQWFSIWPCGCPTCTGVPGTGVNTAED